MTVFPGRQCYRRISRTASKSARFDHDGPGGENMRDAQTKEQSAADHKWQMPQRNSQT